MTRIVNVPSTYGNWMFDASQGKLHTVKTVYKFGHNSAVGTSYEDVWPLGGALTYLTAAATMEAISSDANDTAAGTGARTIIIEGLDENWDFVSESITMNGTSATTATTATFIRVYRAYVSGAGTYGGANTGNITIRVSSAGATQAYIAAGEGQTQMAHYTTPRGVTAALFGFLVSVAASKSVTARVMIRTNADVVSAPCSAWRVALQVDGVTATRDLVPAIPLTIAEKTDIRIEVVAASGTTNECSAAFELLMEGWPYR